MKKIYKTNYICILFFVVTTSLKAQCTFTTVPYYESFSGITNNNQLPACWAASNLSNTCLTYTSAQTQNRLPCSQPGFASFYNSSGSHYFYTKGIYLNAGLTYSTALWYLTEYYGYTNWTDLSILYGTAQNSVSLTSIVSSNGAALSPVCKKLSGTFSVSTSGVYYFAIKATTNGLVGATYLSWDDFSITAPCQLNSTTFSITASSNPVCIGQSVTLTAIGNPGTTFNWNTGATGSVVVVMPNSNTIYSAIGNNTVTACIDTKSISLQVNPTPIVSVFASNSNVCSGNSTTLFPYGASNYSWSTGSTLSTLVVSPSVTTTYTVWGTNSYNCSSSAVQQILVSQLPSVTATPSNTFICAGDEVLITLSGANNYSWTTSVGGGTGTLSPFYKQFAANEFLTITGTDANGCAKTITLNLNVKECAGLNEKSLEKRLYLFPNPTSDFINLIGLNNQSFIELLDLKGMPVFSKSTNDRRMVIDLRGLDNGLYLLRIKSGNEKVEKKIIKD